MSLKDIFLLPSPPPSSGGFGVGTPSFSFFLLPQEPIVRREKVDLLAEKLFKIEWDEGDRPKPRCYIDNGLLEELRKPWNDAVIVTLLGKLKAWALDISYERS